MKGHLQRYNSSSKNVIQIINVESKHWICASNIHCPAEVVDVYDSGPSCSIGSHDMHKQLAAIMQCSAECMYVRHVNVQKQSGPSDCGIAFATALCMGIDQYTHCIHQKKVKCTC